MTTIFAPIPYNVENLDTYSDLLAACAIVQRTTEGVWHWIDEDLDTYLADDERDFRYAINVGCSTNGDDEWLDQSYEPPPRLSTPDDWPTWEGGSDKNVLGLVWDDHGDEFIQEAFRHQAEGLTIHRITRRYLQQHEGIQARLAEEVLQPLDTPSHPDDHWMQTCLQQWSVPSSQRGHMHDDDIARRAVEKIRTLLERAVVHACDGHYEVPEAMEHSEEVIRVRDDEGQRTVRLIGDGDEIREPHNDDIGWEDYLDQRGDAFHTGQTPWMSDRVVGIIYQSSLGWEIRLRRGDRHREVLCGKGFKPRQYKDLDDEWTDLFQHEEVEPVGYRKARANSRSLAIRLMREHLLSRDDCREV
jgi:hypothetical protein